MRHVIFQKIIKRKIVGFHLGFRYADTLPLIKMMILKQLERWFYYSCIDIYGNIASNIPVLAFNMWMSLGEVIKIIGFKLHKSEARNFYGGVKMILLFAQSLMKNATYMIILVISWMLIQKNSDISYTFLFYFLSHETVD